ncbi:hypothetical protein X752_21270 [Mesorhizobium sp. LNJC398B00]|nr:hypothetical protein X752_21270 [Mesorhizobium sp. LNJC398B00]
MTSLLGYHVEHQVYPSRHTRACQSFAILDIKPVFLNAGRGRKPHQFVYAAMVSCTFAVVKQTSAGRKQCPGTYRDEPQARTNSAL